MPDEQENLQATPPPAVAEKTATGCKVLPIVDCKAVEEDGALFLTGYANTKNHADRYGDIPTVFSARRNYVYELAEYLKNPVLLIDHVNSIDHVAGRMVEIAEDERGLKFKAKLSNSDLPLMAHMRTVVKEGHAKGISIAGRFHFENPDAPQQLTYAEIFEISLVAVPADPDSIATAAEKSAHLTDELKSLTKELEIAKMSLMAGENFIKIKTAVDELAAIIRANAQGVN